MFNVYLFDWGDTLMVDFPDVKGKMCDWEIVEVVTGAKATLVVLSKHAKIYIATDADNSSEKDIQRAFQRGGLDQFISGYFCKTNLGKVKGTTDFLHATLKELALDIKQVAVVGDSFDKDIKPAIELGVQAFGIKENALTR